MFLDLTPKFMSLRVHRERVFKERYTLSKAELDRLSAITWKRCKIGCKLVLFINRKLHMSFRLVPESVTLNDLEHEQRNGRYFALFYRIR